MVNEHERNTRLLERLNLLRQVYTQKLPDKLREIETAWEHVCQHNFDREEIRSFHRLVHTLAGSSGTHGLEEISTVASALETCILDMLEQSLLPGMEQRTALELLLDRLRSAINQVYQPSATPMLHESGRPDSVCNELSSMGSIRLVRNDQARSERCVTGQARKGSKASFIVEPAFALATTRDNRLIFLVEDDPDLAQDLALQIGHFGYIVHVFEQLADLKAALEWMLPSAIIMDVIFPEGELAGIDSIHDIPQVSLHAIPVMFISARGDVMTRLRAVRAGGRAYFTKPINVPALIDKLDELTRHKQPEPYRILIIDDDPSQSGYYELVLRQSDIHITIINDPMQVMLPLVDFRPDLILMDVYMPGCTGLELAAVIRQQEAYDGIPIVFLSTETDMDKRLSAMHMGGDDFLTKPIEPEHLISAVTSRAQRSRVLRASMVRDSLTGLLNHTTTKERLYREVAYAQRCKTPLAFAMIDLDQFKQVNDTYGHTTGDRVIKSLSRVLQQRLRRTDVIGRYGGEEFAVMMPDTDGTNAARVLDNIRRGFSQIRQRTESGEFSVSFSCGVTDYPTYQDAATINKVADEALYEAKRSGRNRVVLARR